MKGIRENTHPSGIGKYYIVGHWPCFLADINDTSLGGILPDDQFRLRCAKRLTNKLIIVVYAGSSLNVNIRKVYSHVPYETEKQQLLLSLISSSANMPCMEK